MREEQINFRCKTDIKNEINMASEKAQMSRTEFILSAVMDKIKMNQLLDSEQKFLSLFELGFQTYYEPYFHRLVQNQRSIMLDAKTIIEQNNLFYKNVEMVQERDNMITALYNHPITDIALENVKKNFWKNVSKEKIDA